MAAAKMQANIARAQDTGRCKKADWAARVNRSNPQHHAFYVEKGFALDDAHAMALEQLRVNAARAPAISRCKKVDNGARGILSNPQDPAFYEATGFPLEEARAMAAAKLRANSARARYESDSARTHQYNPQHAAFYECQGFEAEEAQAMAAATMTANNMKATTALARGARSSSVAAATDTLGGGAAVVRAATGIVGVASSGSSVPPSVVVKPSGVTPLRY